MHASLASSYYALVIVNRAKISERQSRSRPKLELLYV